ncbi:hypothetical protein D3C84_894580 [compost metagenome]
MRSLLDDSSNIEARATLDAAATSHTHTSAQGNADILAGSGSGSYGQIGTYGLMIVSDTAAVPGSPGTIYAGTQLRWSNVSGELQIGAPSPAGSWKALCVIVGGSAIGTERAAGLFVRVL